MSIELQVLGWSGVLWVVLLGVAGTAANRQLGTGYLMGPRDEGRTLSGRPARLERALKNHGEGLLLFTVAVLVVSLGERTGPLTQLCAWVYLAARIAYAPAYAYGWTPWRTVFWAVGFLATLVMLLRGLLPL